MSEQVSARLQLALDARGVSHRGFQRAMAARRVRGRSTPAIYRYLSGQVTPEVSFVTSAAEFLHVRAAWLAFGEGEMTADEEGARSRREAAADFRKQSHAADGIKDAFPQFERLSLFTRKALIHAWASHFARADLQESSGRHGDSEGSTLRELGRRIGRVLYAAFRELSIEPAELDPVQLNLYAFAVSSALDALAGETAAGEQPYGTRVAGRGGKGFRLMTWGSRAVSEATRAAPFRATVRLDAIHSGGSPQIQTPQTGNPVGAFLIITDGNTWR